MENTKPWYLSRTIWASIAVAVISLLEAAGLITPSSTQDLAAQMADFATSLVTGGLAVYAVWGRTVATKTIEKKNK